jgi:UDP-2-acetamido-2,6-beta-L-arabino-hexul-4-ose reductase
MKVLITGARGFIGKNLIATLHNLNTYEVLAYDVDSDQDLLGVYCQECDVVVHLAGVNRPVDVNEYMSGNFGFTSVLLSTLQQADNHCPIIVTSSIQAALENPYGQSKKAGEELLMAYGKEHGSKIIIYRLPNVFGKWCRPNYNSVIATFCYNITRNLPITVNDPKVELQLVYIDDLVESLIGAMHGEYQMIDDFGVVPVTHQLTLGALAQTLNQFNLARQTNELTDLSDPLMKKLYSTYLSYLPPDQFAYPLKMNTDQRGSFTEFLKMNGYGQVSVNVTKPGITKGNHWHHTKVEKFMVVSGLAKIRFRQPDNDQIIEYLVDGSQLMVVDIPVGYTHNIENVGTTDLVTIMWANEAFDPKRPDTYFLEV